MLPSEQHTLFGITFLLQGEALHMESSDGEPQDYIHVADAVRALVLAFQQDPEHGTLDISSG